MYNKILLEEFGIIDDIFTLTDAEFEASYSYGITKKEKLEECINLIIY